MALLLTKNRCGHEAWVHAVATLIQSGDQANLMVEFPAGCAAHDGFEREYDELLAGHGGLSLNTVINTVFPKILASCSGDRNELYSRYARLYPRVLRDPRSNRGTYFGRLIGYDRERNIGLGVNQIEHVIETLSSTGGLRHAGEMTLVVPEKDRRPMGFPCLSHLSLHREEGGTIRLTAVYRNHYFMKRALGNYLSLDSLLGFVSREAGLVPGTVTVVSTAASIDGPAYLAQRALELWPKE